MRSGFWFRSRRLRVTARGASGLTYGILVGLIAVVGIASVTNAGGSVNRLFGTVASRLLNVRPVAVATATPAGCIPTRALDSCEAHRLSGCSSTGSYRLNPASEYDAWCEMSLDGGGWTHVMTLNVADGNLSNFPATIWTSSTAGSYSSRFTNDYRGPASDLLTGTRFMIVVRLANAPETGAVKGWRSWILAGPRTYGSFFSGSIGAFNANATGGCNGGYSGAGTQQTSGVGATGSCASFGSQQDTMTCHATNVYTNSYYGSCESNGDAFRISSWYRWANNSNVGLGLQMDGAGGSYETEAGTHIAWDTTPDPQRYGAITPGTDYTSPISSIGESWRYEMYMK